MRSPTPTPTPALITPSVRAQQIKPVKPVESVPSPIIEPVSENRPKAGFKPGFKPIGQASSAVKRFFPGDDDSTASPSPAPAVSAAATRTGPQSATNGSALLPAKPVARPSPLPNGLPKKPTFEPNTASTEKENRATTVASRDLRMKPPIIEQTKEAKEAAVTPKEFHNSMPTPKESQGPTRPPKDSRESQGPMPAPKGAKEPMAAPKERMAAPKEVKHSAGPPHDREKAAVRRQSFAAMPSPITPSPSDMARADVYSIIGQVGEGTFGKVYKAKNNVTQQFVALKRIRMEAEREGFPVTAMREIKLLQSLRHENIIRLYEMMSTHSEKSECIMYTEYP